MFARLSVLSFVFVLRSFALPVAAQAQDECDNYTGYAVITPLSSPTVYANTGGNIVEYSVYNAAGSFPWCYAEITLNASQTGNVTYVYSPGTVYALPGPEYAVTVDVTFDVGMPGSGTIEVFRYDSCADQCGVAYVSIMANNGPVISLVDYHEGFRDPSRCVADCFDAVATYSTPPYYSADQPRSVDLVYRSSHARPMAFLNIAAWDTTAMSPIRMSVRLVDEITGNFVNFVYGGGASGTEFFFSCPSGKCDSTTNRLAVQFDASSIQTGAYTYTLFVRAYRPDTSFSETQRKIKILIQNEWGSPFGHGWTIAGYQRLYRVGNDSVFITDGNGSMSFFRINTYPCWPCSYKSPAGDFTTVSYSAAEENAGFFRKSPDGTRVGFDTTGKIRWVKDRHGRKTAEFVYNGSNQLVAIKDISGQRDTLIYSNNRLQFIRGPSTGTYRTTITSIDASGYLYEITDHVGGKPFRGTYDALRRLATRTDRRGSVAGFAYDHANKVKADTAPLIRTSHGNNERPVVRFIALESSLIPDTASHLGSFSSPASPGDSRTMRAKRTNARGMTTAYALDRFRQPTRIEQPMGRRTRYTIDTLGRHVVDSLPEGNGHLLRYTWGGSTGSSLVQEKDSTTGRVVNYVYDATYNLMTLRSGDIDSVIVVLTGDKKAESTRRIGGARDSTRNTYNGSPHWHAECVSVGPSDPAYWSTCRYVNPAGLRNTDSTIVRRWPNMFPNSPEYRPTTRYQFDGYGQIVRTISPVGDTTWTAYDMVGRVWRTIGPKRDTTEFTYGDSLNLTQVRDGRGQIYKIWRNAVGWPDSTEDPANQRTRFTYDSAGNPVAVVNRRSQIVTFMYDSLDNMRLKIAGMDTTKFFVDPLGRFNWSANKESIDTLKLDSAGRPWVEISCRLTNAGGSYQCFRDSSAYDIRHLRTKLLVNGPSWSDTASFHYNPHLQLDTLTNFSGEKEIFTFGGSLHDSTRRLVALNNLLLTHNRVAYTPWGANAAVTFSDASLTQQIGLSYGFDSTSRVMRYSRGALGTPDTIRFFVDSGGRLSQSADTSFTWSGNACAVGPFGITCDTSKVSTQTAAGAESFFYDKVGNRKEPPHAGYVHPGNRVFRLGLIRMTYDLDGNLVQKRTLNEGDTTKTVRTDSLFWNALGQLDSMHSADSLGVNTLKIRWGYDGRGRQVRQSVGADTVRFVWDGDTRIVKTDKQGARKAHWTYYPGTQRPQSVFLTPSVGDTTTSYYITDALHNTVALLKSENGNWVLHGQFRYGAYGDSLGATGAGVGDAQLRYKGAFYDGYTRLYRMGSRYYDPDVGRFISEDPLGIDGAINQYAFAGGDPVNGYDPSGNLCIPCGAALLLFASITGTELLAGTAIGLALFTALEVTVAATQLAGFSAAIEHASGGRPFEQGFAENFVATAIFLSGQAWIGTAAGVYHSASVNGIQPYVRFAKPSAVPGGAVTAGPGGAITAGLSAGFYDRLDASAGTLIIKATLKAHELGHTLQYLGLSALGKKWHPWVSYALLGAPGMIGIGLGGKWQRWLHSFSPWENMASGFGKLVNR